MQDPAGNFTSQNIILTRQDPSLRLAQNARRPFLLHQKNAPSVAQSNRHEEKDRSIADANA
jgi:hypothetical protein